jgi:hypothetical protein
MCEETHSAAEIGQMSLPTADVDNAKGRLRADLKVVLSRNGDVMNKFGIKECYVMCSISQAKLYRYKLCDQRKCD